MSAGVGGWDKAMGREGVQERKTSVTCWRGGVGVRKRAPGGLLRAVNGTEGSKRRVKTCRQPTFFPGLRGSVNFFKNLVYFFLVFLLW